MQSAHWFETMNATVVVADDETGVRELLAAWLARIGCHVLPAADGEEALRLIRDGVDLAVLDVMMPGRTGFAVCRATKTAPETRLIPVILVTGLASVEDRIQGIEAGADDFLSKPVDRQELLARVRSLLRLKQFTDELENAETVICSLGLSVEAKDAYTQGHCERLAAGSAALGARLGLPEEQILALRRGGFVHDIGKIGIPDHILCKPGPLTAEERAIMQAHPVIGERICAPLRSFRAVLPIIRHHHEKLDGSGYPDGLKGDAVPLAARVLQTVDIYDALTTQRPYRVALPREEALARMRYEQGLGWWDGALIDELERLLSENPTLFEACHAAPSQEALVAVMAASSAEPGSASPPADLPGLPRGSTPAGPVRVETPLPLRQLERVAILRAITDSAGNKVAAARNLGISRATLYRKLREYGAA